MGYYKVKGYKMAVGSMLGKVLIKTTLKEINKVLNGFMTDF